MTALGARRAARASGRRASGRCSRTSARPSAVLAASREELEAVPGLPRQGRARDPRPAAQGRLSDVGGRARLQRVRRRRRREPTARCVDLVVITGYSGAGKSEAIAAVRGRRLLLRRQPAAGDDPRRSSSCSCHEGIEGRARRGRLRRARRRRTSSELSRCSTSSTRPGLDHRVLFLEADERDAARPLQGDAPAPSAGARGQRREGIRAERELLAPLRERADVVDRHDRPDGARRCAASIADELLPRASAGAAGA